MKIKDWYGDDYPPEGPGLAIWILGSLTLTAIVLLAFVIRLALITLGVEPWQ